MDLTAKQVHGKPQNNNRHVANAAYERRRGGLIATHVGELLWRHYHVACDVSVASGDQL